jgi:hypothetical protein
MARPTKFSDRRMGIVCSALRDGCTRSAAAGAAGVHYDTFLEWTKEFSEFSEAVMRAEAEAEKTCTVAILKAAKGTKTEPGDWRAAESWLKRRRRKEWGDNVAVTADRRAAELLAELFPDDAGEDPAPAGEGEDQETPAH